MLDHQLNKKTSTENFDPPWSGVSRWLIDTYQVEVHTKWNKHNLPMLGKKIEDIFKVHLLHEESNTNLFQICFTRELYEIITTNDAGEDWNKIEK